MFNQFQEWYFFKDLEQIISPTMVSTAERINGAPGKYTELLLLVKYAKRLVMISGPMIADKLINPAVTP
jgi:hypothetical protein